MYRKYFIFAVTVAVITELLENFFTNHEVTLKKDHLEQF